MKYVVSWTPFKYGWKVKWDKTEPLTRRCHFIYFFVMYQYFCLKTLSTLSLKIQFTANIIMWLSPTMSLIRINDYVNCSWGTGKDRYMYLPGAALLTLKGPARLKNKTNHRKFIWSGQLKKAKTYDRIIYRLMNQKNKFSKNDCVLLKFRPKTLRGQSGKCNLLTIFCCDIHRYGFGSGEAITS